jgi:hypothetical protein
MTMKSLIGIAAVLAGLSSLAFAQQPKPAPPPAAAELEYDAFCKKTQQEKRSLFRAAAPTQKALLMRNQMERFRDANRARLTKEQLDLLTEVLTALTPAAFEDNKEAQAKMAALSDRIEKVFSNEDQDAMDRDGPCLPKSAKDDPQP